MGSVEFSKLLLSGGVAVSPGVGFGEYGEGFVLWLIENEHRTRQASRHQKGVRQGPPVTTEELS